MSKKSQLDLAIESLDGEIAVLQMAKAKLEAQRKAKAAKKPAIDTTDLRRGE